jgi:uncharacterized membrane protein
MKFLFKPLFWLLLLGLILRLPLLNGSFWLDEAAQALESSRPLTQQLQIRDDFQPPLIHLLIHFMMIFSQSEWFLRTGAAVIPGLITIWGVYEIGKRVQNKTTGYIAALLMATSSFHIFYSQELRPYSLPTLFGVLSWLLIIQLDKKKNLSWQLCLYAMCSLAGLYSSYLYPFLFITQIGFVLWMYKKIWKQYLIAVLSIGAGFALWLPSFIDQFRAGQTLRSTLPGWEKIVSFTQMKAIALVVGKFVFGVLDLELNATYLLFLALVVMGIGVMTFGYLHRKEKKKELTFFWMLLCWCIIPVLLAWLVSFVVPVLQAKRVLFCLPAFYLWIACVLTHFLSQQKWKKTVLIFLILLCGVNIYSTLSYYILPKYHREDWRSLHQELLQKYPPTSSAIVFAFTGPFASWEWYDHGLYTTLATGVVSSSETPQLKEIKKLSTYRYILVFDYLRDLTDPQHLITVELNGLGYKEVDQITPNTPIGIVHVFTRKENTIGQVMIQEIR